MMFSEVVWTTELNIGNYDLVQKCLEHKKNNPKSENRSNYGGWHSKDIAANNNVLDPFIEVFDEITTNVNEFKNYLLIKNGLLTHLQGGWIVINGHKDCNFLHRHGGSVVSGVLYVYAVEGQGDLVFEEGSGIKLDYVGNNLFDSHTSITASKYRVKPRTGLLVLFPSWYKHMVLPNETTEERIALSFNYGFIEPLNVFEQP